MDSVIFGSTPLSTEKSSLRYSPVIDHWFKNPRDRVSSPNKSCLKVSRLIVSCFLFGLNSKLVAKPDFLSLPPLIARLFLIDPIGMELIDSAPSKYFSELNCASRLMVKSLLIPF